MPQYIPMEEYNQLKRKYAVNTSRYSKPVRLYVDIDGVLLPLIYEDFLKPYVEYVSSDIPAVVKIQDRTRYFERRDIEMESVTGHLTYRPEVLAALQKWGADPRIDLVFLTSWNMNAARGIGEALSIPNLGYLPWEPRGLSDSIQAGKLTAIIKDQEAHPSHIAWLEDTASQLMHELLEGLPANPSQSILSIKPELTVGLTDEHIDRVDMWLDALPH